MDTKYIRYFLYLIGGIIVLISNSNILAKNSSMNRDQVKRHAILNIIAITLSVITITSSYWVKDLIPFLSFSSYYIGITIIIIMHAFLLYKHIYLHEVNVNEHSSITLIASGLIIFGWINNILSK